RLNEGSRLHNIDGWRAIVGMPINTTGMPCRQDGHPRAHVEAQILLVLSILQQGCVLPGAWLKQQ
ncbi:MAG TPA: hypothetical protein VFT99_03230, partial [Roseiflexaceae bacterium]|nr:hypothetical protein [Roseiflexaceae bacterium]